MPKLDRVLETSLYVEDPQRSAEFYHRILGFETILVSERLIAMSVEGRQVLLLFRKGGSVQLPLTPHDGNGQLHLAFAIPATELDAWEKRLADNHLPIAEKRLWERGGTSLYFRDPDGHLLELAAPGVWTIY
jgi:catechol 2,3-dioxygenase-like lactoylglutathione lyase family enzyme